MQELELISKPPRWPAWHSAHISLAQPTPLKLNWATGSVITDGWRSRVWFLMNQKFINFRIQILPFEHEWEVPAKSSTQMQALAHQNHCASAHFRTKIKECSCDLFQRRYWTGTLIHWTNFYLMCWEHNLSFFIPEREGIVIFVFLEMTDITLTRATHWTEWIRDKVVHNAYVEWTEHGQQDKSIQLEGAIKRLLI